MHPFQKSLGRWSGGIAIDEIGGGGGGVSECRSEIWRCGPDSLLRCTRVDAFVGRGVYGADRGERFDHSVRYDILEGMCEGKIRISPSVYAAGHTHINQTLAFFFNVFMRAIKFGCFVSRNIRI